MTFRRALLIGLAVAVAVGTAVVIAAFTPAVQRWALLRAVRDIPGLKLGVDRVSAGPGSFAVRGLTVERGGLVVRIDSAEGDFALWPLLTGKGVNFARFQARGVNVDATKVSASTGQAAVAGVAAAPAAAPGAISRIELPVAVTLEVCEIEGRALVPVAVGKPPLAAEYRITGGGVAPGAAGNFHLQARLINGETQARVSELRVQADLQLVQSTRRTFDRIGARALVDGVGSVVPENNQLKIAAELTSAGGGDSYALTVETVHGGASDRLATVNAMLPQGGNTYAGDWAVNVRTAQIEPFFFGGTLPQFEARGAGGFSLAPASGAITAKGWIEASAHRLENIQPALRPIGVVEVESGFDLEWMDGTLVLNRLDATVIGDRPVFEIHTAQPVRAVLGKPEFQMTASTPGEVLRLKLPGLPLAWLRPFIHEADVSGGAVVGEIAVSAEGNRLTAATVSPLQIDALNVVREGRPLLLKGGVTADFQLHLDNKGWGANFRRLSLITPAGDSLSAQLSAESGQGVPVSLQVAGSYEAKLPAMLEPWAAGLRVQAGGDFDVGLSAAELGVTKFTSTVRLLDGPPLLTIASRQPFRFLPATRRIAAKDAGASLLEIELGRIDLAPLLSGYPTGLVGTITGGAFSLGLDGERWSLRATKPLAIAGLDLLAEPGRTASLGGLQVRLEPGVALADAATIKAQSGDVAVTLADGTALGVVQAELEQAGGGWRASARFNLDLPVLSRLPAFATAGALAQGRAAGEVRAVLGGDAQQAEARITLNGLVARDGGKPLPVANISFRGVRNPDGSATVEVPVLFDRSGLRSDLKFAAALQRTAGGHRLDASLSGEQASLDDILAVLGVFSPAPAPRGAPPKASASASKSPPEAVVADTRPPWAWLTGRMRLDIKSITHGTEWTMSGLNGALTLDPMACKLEQLEAGFGPKGRFSAKGDLSFVGGAQPYKLAGDLALSEFDAGPLFRALEPGRPPTVEGVFAVDGHAESSGRTLDETMARVRGQFQLTSRQGIFRGLKRGSEKMSVASKAVELGAVLGSLFGSDKVKEAAEKVAGNAYFADQIAQELGELKYDQLTVRLTRDEALNVQLPELSLISPEVRMVGKGSVTHVEGAPLLEQPLSVEATIAGRGKIENLFGRARLLDGQRDELGYARVKYPVVIGGTMAKPDVVSFYSRLAASKLVENLNGDN